MNRWLPITCLVTLVTAAVRGDDAILPDGSMQAIEPAMVANLSDTTWPGWIALRRSVTLRDDDAARSMVGLDDGQRVGGGFASVQDALWWRSRAIGAMQLDLEHVAWIGPPTLASRPAPARDHVQLVNGDHVDGFVNALQADRGVEVETDAGGAGATRAWYEIATIESIQLAPRPRAATGWRLWLRDGSAVDVESWRREGSRVTLEGLHLSGAAPRVMIAWDEVIGIQRAAQSMIPLANLSWKADDAGGGERLAPAQARVDADLAALDLRSIDLNGPGTFQTRVPPGRWTLDLSIGAPPALASRIGCTVQVLAGDRELARMRLEPGAKPTRVHAAVQGGDLRVVISESAHGAFGAAARLDSAMLVPVTAGEPTPSPAPTSAPAGAAGSPGPG